jgi:hypothetical protein
VSPLLHQPQARVTTAYPPAGGRPRDYGPGRQGGCGHLLSRYNPGPLCRPCHDNQRRAECGAPASAGGEAAANAAPAPRSHEQRPSEGGEMKPSRTEESKALILSHLGALGHPQTMAAMHEALQVPKSCLCALLNQLHDEGRIACDLANVDGRRKRLYRLPSAEAPGPSSDEVAKSATAPPAEAQEDAKDDGQDEEPGAKGVRWFTYAGEPLEPAPAVAPFAGIAPAPAVDQELDLLHALERLEEKARDRVLTYAFDRWWYE